MPLIANVAGFAAFGFTVRAYALALQKRPILDNISGHFLMAGGFGALGYWLYGIQERQNELIEARKQIVLENRQKREANA
ncbi:uncharacterized protein VTP21DRAFT_8076 [Calcarisporiella thermophila]|uniref:uncharacterized protein n=1 Tax=Calcarisporiella thermophila TaxID=911321 RepID=UPI00374339F9